VVTNRISKAKQIGFLYIEAMDLKIEISAQADCISASALGIVNTLLPLTDKKSAPESC